MELWQYKVVDLPENQNTNSSLVLKAKDIGLEADGFELTSPLAIDVVLFRTDRDVFVDVTMRGEIKNECRLCLKPLSAVIETEFSIRYELTADAELVDDPFAEVGLCYYMGDFIDLSVSIGEAFVLAVPHWPECSEGCRGLCPVCGENLNQGSCDCDLSVVRPGKLAALSSLLGE